ncbi:MAG: hypothetical protein IT324_04775 [Anaerolineae bacterium]|nr:hypothetical protein [Anaerolineae bacterium]
MSAIMLADFRTGVLGPLLRGERPTSSMPLALFAVQIDHPLRYLFESDRWDEVSGASKRLTRANEKMRAVLAADGYTTDDLLHADGGSLLALVHDQTVAERWSHAIQRAVALETDIVTVSTLAHPVTTDQLLNGLYRAPRAVIGVPGVSDYQQRINRYYGLDSPSTIPKEDTIAQRRHFGEVIALVHSLLIRAQESRQIVPFYESLAFAERCVSCGLRPAERLADDPICGVCLRKREETSADKHLPEAAALVWIEAVAFERLLEQQRAPLAYHRLYTAINEALHLAVPGRLGTTILASGGGWLLFAVPAAHALDAATSALEAVVLHYGLKPPTAFITAVALADALNQWRALADLVRHTLVPLRQASAGGECLLDVRLLGRDRAFDRFRKPYTVGEARRLTAGLTVLHEAPLPGDVFPQLPEQIARGNAGLYYTLERAKLSSAEQDTLRRLERAWDAGSTPGPRFYTLLADALALARLAN